jgi:formylglycine-generating enzyme required for sulfatase activity
VLCELGRDGRLVFLLDGLDELQGPARTELDKRLRGLPRRCKVIVSTRRYQHTGSLPDFFDADLAPLTPEQASALLEKLLLCRVATRHQAGDLATTWRASFTSGAAVWQQLSKVPLFVTLIAEMLMGGKAPTATRAAFFDEVLEHLILNQHRGEDAVDPKRAQAGSSPMVVPNPKLEGSDQKQDTKLRVQAVLDVLGHVAMAMTEASAVEAAEDHLRAWIDSADEHVRAALARLKLDAEDFVDDVAGMTGVLGPEGPRSDPATKWRFWHRSFQEALTAWDLERRLALGTNVDVLLERVSVRPSATRIAEQEQALAAAFEQEDEALWDPLNELLTVGSSEEREQVWKHNDGTGWDLAATKPLVARFLAPYRARQAQQDFWIEPTCLLAARWAENRAKAWPQRSNQRMAAIDSETFVTALLTRDREFGRCAVSRLVRSSADLLAKALSATSWSDAQVQGAKTPVDVWLGMTNRLREREVLYASAPSRVAPSELADLLAARAATVDDPGELFVIAMAAHHLRDPQARGRAEAAIAARLAARTPDPALWRDHFVALEGGRYRRGSQAERSQRREQPVHDVELTPFALGRTPVTVAQWRQFWPEHRMAYLGEVKTLAKWGQAKLADGERFEDLPVTNVSWFAAHMLCRWLLHHRTLLGTSWGSRVPALPSEAQAEYAIRGGEPGEWWFGAEHQAGEHAWFEANAGGRPRAVGTKRANGFGLHDVVGNVLWWCRDAYDPRAYAAVGSGSAFDPLVLGSSASSRVVRGGSFANPVHNLRSAYRFRYLPAYANWNLGVRVALVAAPSELGSALDLRSLGM